MIPPLHRLTAKLGHEFKTPALLEQALRHRSMRADHNERLEFLGDSVLNFIIAAELFQRYPHAKEGDLSRMRANLVNGDMLAEIAQEFALGDYLQLGVGELKSGGSQRSSILADALEAIIGAIYLDAGFQVVQPLVLIWFSSRLNDIKNLSKQKDAKTTLQESLQARSLALPIYTITHTEGEAHAQVFHVECKVEHLSFIGIGSGTSRRRAEQEAAQHFLTQLLSHE